MHISKPDIFIPVNNRLHRSGSANRPWLLAVGAGWWHVLREASSGKYKPIQRQRAQDRSACRYIPLLCKLIGLLRHIRSCYCGSCVLRVQPSWRKSSTDPVPGPPHPLCRQRAGEIRIRDTDEPPFRCSRPQLRECGAAAAHRGATNIMHGEKNSQISPNSPPNVLYWWFKGPDPLVSHTLCAFTPRFHRAKRLPLRYQCLSTPLPPSCSLPPSLLLPPSIRWGDSRFSKGLPRKHF